jgi:hypothetical protein
MTPPLTAEQVLARRMRNLLLHRRDGTRPSTVDEVVTWFGAMQAQDLTSGLFSLATRLGAPRTEVEAALERREALRTWPMRGTLHLVPSRDAAWMLEVMGERPLAGARRRRERLGLSEADADRAADVLGSALAGGGRLTRAECVAVLERAGIPAAGQRAYHLLWYASQRGVTCIAPNVAGEQTFVLLAEWAPESARPSRDEALATIAVRYFRSHGPTSRQDLAGWTGMTAADTKRGIAVAGDLLETVAVDGREMVQATSRAPGHTSEVHNGDDDEIDDDVVALPGFDEYLLGYKDRSLMLAAADMAAVIPGRNGVFQATVVRAGRVVATWKKRASRSRPAVDVAALCRMSASERERVEQAFAPYSRFVDEPVDVRWRN